MPSSGTCPECGSDGLKTKDSRPHDDPNVVRWRVKECSECGYRFTTHEIIMGEHGHEHVHKSVLLFIADVEKAARDRLSHNGKLMFGTVKEKGAQ